MASGESEEYLPMTPVDKAEDRPYVEVGGTSAIPRVKPPVSLVLDPFLNIHSFQGV